MQEPFALSLSKGEALNVGAASLCLVVSWFARSSSSGLTTNGFIRQFTNVRFTNVRIARTKH